MRSYLTHSVYSEWAFLAKIEEKSAHYFFLLFSFFFAKLKKIQFFPQFLRKIADDFKKIIIVFLSIIPQNSVH